MVYSRWRIGLVSPNDFLLFKRHHFILERTRSVNVLVVEPYFGGSHRAFLESLRRHSQHTFALATLPARHWKWRMRSAPLAILEAAFAAIETHGPPDAVLCTDMLDLPTFLGLVGRTPTLAPLLKTPLVAYFHENQWAYPTAPSARVDHHYGYTNLLTAVVADEVWFNSEFNRQTFVDGSRAFLKRMPDGASAHDLNAIEAKSLVIPPGFEACPLKRESHDGPIRIGWVGRFEHDKRPDRFLRLLELLVEHDFDFELVLLGPRDESNAELNQIRARFGTRILFDGFADSRDDYWHWLSRIDVVVSTADHEFFGIAICEAISAGAVPVTPNGLSYTEYVPQRLRFDSLNEATAIIKRLQSKKYRDLAWRRCRDAIVPYEASTVAQTIDREMERAISAE